MKYYFCLDDNNYLTTIFTSDLELDTNLFLESLDKYNFNGSRLQSYKYDDGQLIFDEERYVELKAIDDEERRLRETPSPEYATQEIVDAMYVDLEYKLTLLEMGQT